MSEPEEKHPGGRPRKASEAVKAEAAFLSIARGIQDALEAIDRSPATEGLGEPEAIREAWKSSRAPLGFEVEQAASNEDRVNWWEPARDEWAHPVVETALLLGPGAFSLDDGSEFEILAGASGVDGEGRSRFSGPPEMVVTHPPTQEEREEEEVRDKVFRRVVDGTLAASDAHNETLRALAGRQRRETAAREGWKSVSDPELATELFFVVAAHRDRSRPDAGTWDLAAAAAFLADVVCSGGPLSRAVDARSGFKMPRARRLAAVRRYEAARKAVSRFARRFR